MNTLKLSLSEADLGPALSKLRLVQAECMYAADLAPRQPVHTMYGGAHLFKLNTIPKIAEIALKTFETYGIDFTVFARAIGLPGCVALQSSEIAEFCQSVHKDSRGMRESDPGSWLAAEVYSRVLQKLQSQPVEDYRIDFEDGYGIRSDAEEDEHALSCASTLAGAMKQKLISPFIGIRVKAFSEEFCQRSIRTLDLFVTRLLDESGGILPENFVVTLPKCVSPVQVEAFVEVLQTLESCTGLAPGSLVMELMIETPQSIINSRGDVAVPHLVAAAGGRCRAVHFGAYDYTAACDVAASHQSLEHQYCDFARSVMKTSLAGTGVWLSDGATIVLPVGPHRQLDGGALEVHQQRENMRVVHDAWRLSFRHILASLEQGFYQGWDLHPAQLPVRFAACYTFFLQNLPMASQRLKAFLDLSARASLSGNSFDDAATGQGLLNFFLRGLNCGALSSCDLQDVGLSLDELQTRSFVKILQARRQKPI